VADDGRPLGQPADDRGDVVGDLADGLAREHLGMLPGLLDGVRVVRPPGGQRRVAGLLEQRRPAVPAGRQQEEAVHEDNRGEPGGVRVVNLAGLVFGDRRAGSRAGGHVLVPFAVA
jgi:hypothetical protein